jgi:hypothetical protein
MHPGDWLKRVWRLHRGRLSVLSAPSDKPPDLLRKESVARARVMNVEVAMIDSGLQSNRMRRLLVALVGVSLLGGSAHAADFRITSDVYFGDKKEPVGHVVTYFRNGVVYDEAAGGEITIYDPLRERFVMLDPKREVKTEFVTEQVRTFTRQLHDRIASSESEFARFAVEPEFEISEDPETDEVVFTSEWMVYRVRSKTVEEDTLRQYEEFADWSAQLNPLVDASAPPPFARLSVNKELNRRNAMPLAVHLTWIQNARFKRDKEIHLRSTHELNDKLRADDLRRIEWIGEKMAAFKSVSLLEYRQREVAETTKTSSRSQRDR